MSRSSFLAPFRAPGVRGVQLAAAAIVVVFLAGAGIANAQVEGYYRFPTVRGETLVFNAEGDLWAAHVTGGAARRLTSHPGQETFPVLSPDGSQVVFAAAYEGAAELYVMPIGGGLPRRLTWDGSGSTAPVVWTDDGRVVYRTTRYSGLPNTQLFAVDPRTFERKPVELAQAADAAFAPDGTIWFTRLPRQGSNSRWYKGGMVQTLWKWRPGETTATRLAGDWPGTTKNPVMSGNRIYVLSDRGGYAMNVWSMALDLSDLRQHTFEREFDIQEHSVDSNTVVYRLGADLWSMSLSGGTPRRLEITLVSDVDQRRETWEEEPARYLTSVGLSPDGDRLVLASRGEVFVAPVEKGRLAFVSRDSAVRHRSATFAPDGKSLFTLSDASGEVEWWRLPADGVGEPVRITNGPAMLRLPGAVSPDGKLIAHQDYDRVLWIVDVGTGTSTRVVDPDEQWASQGSSLAWSPDSRYLVFTATGPVRMSTLHLYDTETRTLRALTSERYEDFSPAWSESGDWLYFLSNRDFVAGGNVWGARAEQPTFDRETRIYALAMTRAAEWPFRVPNELTATADSSRAGASPSTASTAKAPAGSTSKPSTVPAAKGPGDALSVGALRVLPVSRGNLSGLEANGSRIFWLESKPAGQSLMALDLKHDAEPIAVAEGVNGFELSRDGKKMLVVMGGDYHVVAASSSAGAKLADGKVDLAGWRFPVDKAAEWRQIFVDAWRLHRDYFYDPNMHGLDWDAIRAKYEPLVDRIGAREELADLQAQMVSELSLMHSNAGGGDVRQGDDDVLPGALGAAFEKDAATGGFRVVRVYASDPDLPEAGSPLAHPDAEVAEGAIVLAVNGQPAGPAPDIGALLRGQAGRPVRLRISEPGKGERDVLVTAISTAEDGNLRYSEWEYTRRKAVDEASGGAIGYVHLRAMGGGDIAQWTREFYPVFNRQGLVLDVRHNGGGNIDSWILGQLMRRAWMYWKGRSGDPYWNMQYAFRGHVVVLVNERTASDGEAFADGFRRLGLGKTIGTRTWGGEVWLSGSNTQVDGGVARASETGVYGPDGTWLIEGWGFVPDIEVDNDPHQAFLGRDTQLEAAIEHLQRLIRDDPRPVPPVPPYPVVKPGIGYPTVFDH